MGFVAVVISAVVSVISVPASTDVVVIGDSGIVTVDIFADGSDVEDGSVDGSVGKSVFCVVVSIVGSALGIDDTVDDSVDVDSSGEVLMVELSEEEFVVSLVSSWRKC